jgi:hypothetical protein
MPAPIIAPIPIIVALSNPRLGTVSLRCDVVIDESFRGLIVCRNIEWAILVNRKCHYDLRFTGGNRWNPGESKFPERRVVFGNFVLDLKDADGDRSLVVRRGSQRFRSLRRQVGSLRDE